MDMRINMNIDLINVAIKDRIMELVSTIYNNYSGVGGKLHVVLENRNLKDDDIEWCIDNTIPTIEDNHERQVYLECARLLLKLSYSSRYRLIDWILI